MFLKTKVFHSIKKETYIFRVMLLPCRPSFFPTNPDITGVPGIFRSYTAANTAILQFSRDQTGPTALCDRLCSELPSSGGEFIVERGDIMIVLLLASGDSHIVAVTNYPDPTWTANWFANGPFAFALFIRDARFIGFSTP